MHKKILSIGMILLLILINGCVGNMKNSNMPSTSGKIQEINIKQTENNLKWDLEDGCGGKGHIDSMHI